MIGIWGTQVTYGNPSLISRRYEILTDIDTYDSSHSLVVL